MVYESDFYTTRRPYSRPTVTSYSVTRREVPWDKVPLVPRPSQVAPCFTVFGTRSVPDGGTKFHGLGKGQTYHHHVPTVGHKRLVIVSPLAHVSTRSRPSVILGEIDRIYHKVRPSLAFQPTEDYLNSYSAMDFDDETRSIRAKTAELLKRIHSPVPRAQRPMPLPGESVYVELPDDWHDWYSGYPEEMGQTHLRLKLTSLKRDLQDLVTNAYYSHTELPITNRITSENYIDRLLSANKEVVRDINTMSHFEQPARHYNSIGRGHLACVSFAGGRPISKRRNLASDDVVRDDIKVLSHYGRFRHAAAAGSSAVPVSEPEYAPPVHRPPTKSSVTGSWKSNAPRSQKSDSKSSNLTAGEDFDAAQDRKQRRRDAVEAAAAREVEEEKRRKNEVSRQDELAQQALVDRQREMERKAQEEEERLEEERIQAELRAKEEEERKLREEEERLAEEERIREEEEAAKKLREEEEKKAKKAKKEAEKKAKEEAERKAKEEAEQKAREEAEEKARLEAEQKAKEEAERIAREEEEQKVKEEAERLKKEEEERLAKEEADRIAREAEEQQAKEEAERIAKEEAERIANEEAEAAAAAAPEPTPEATEEDTVGDASAEATVEVAAEPDAAEEPEVEEVKDEPAEAGADNAAEVEEEPSEEEEE